MRSSKIFYEPKGTFVAALVTMGLELEFCIAAVVGLYVAPSVVGLVVSWLVCVWIWVDKSVVGRLVDDDSVVGEFVVAGPVVGSSVVGIIVVGSSVVTSIAVDSSVTASPVVGKIVGGWVDGTEMTIDNGNRNIRISYYITEKSCRQ